MRRGCFTGTRLCPRLSPPVSCSIGIVGEKTVRSPDGTLLTLNARLRLVSTDNEGLNLHWVNNSGEVGQPGLCNSSSCAFKGWYNPDRDIQRWCEGCQKWWHNPCLGGWLTEEQREEEDNRLLELWNKAPLDLSPEEVELLKEVALDPVERGCDGLDPYGNGNAVFDTRQIMSRSFPGDVSKIVKEIKGIREAWGDDERPIVRKYRCENCQSVL